MLLGYSKNIIKLMLDSLKHPSFYLTLHLVIFLKSPSNIDLNSIPGREHVIFWKMNILPKICLMKMIANSRRVQKTVSCYFQSRSDLVHLHNLVIKRSSNRLKCIYTRSMNQYYIHIHTIYVYNEYVFLFLYISEQIYLQYAAH